MPSAATGQPARCVDDAALRNASKSGEEWLTYGRDPGETRYSLLNQVNVSNVSRLGLKWTYDLGVGGGNQEATPLVRNGVLYGITNWSVVFAVDFRTGKDVKTGLRGGMGPPITYQIDGIQYISLMGGTGRVTPSVGNAPPPVAMTPALPKLLTFVLDGAASPR